MPKLITDLWQTETEFIQAAGFFFSDDGGGNKQLVNSNKRLIAKHAAHANADGYVSAESREVILVVPKLWQLQGRPCVQNYLLISAVLTIPRIQSLTGG